MTVSDSINFLNGIPLHIICLNYIEQQNSNTFCDEEDYVLKFHSQNKQTK